MDDQQVRGYLQDLLGLVCDSAIDARTARDQAKGTKDETFANGRLLAYYEVISLAKSQAVAFRIEEAQLGLADIDPDRDLI